MLTSRRLLHLLEIELSHHPAKKEVSSAVVAAERGRDETYVVGYQTAFLGHEYSSVRLVRGVVDLKEG